MKMLSRWLTSTTCAAFVVACALLPAGCSTKPAAPPAPSGSIGGGQYGWLRFKELKPEAGLDFVQAHYVTWGDSTSGQSLAILILSDVTYRGSIRTDSSGQQASGQHSSADADGRKVEWKCTTSDGKTGNVTINDRPYDLAQGSLFLVSAMGAEVRVLQLMRDTLKVKVGNDPKDALESVIKGDADIGPFFADAGKPK